MEYLTYYEITDGYDDAFDQYVRTGGMPGAYVYKTEDRQYDYVRDVYSTILVRDLVEKYKIRNKSEFTNISEFMMDNIGNLLSPNNISKTLNNDRSEITRKTVSKYIGYLENAFLFYEAKRYDLKGKKYLANNSKYYLCDSSFRYAVNGTRNMDFGRVYENIVYLELRRRGYEVYVGKLYKREVDFVAKKRETQIYIQVSDNISDEKIFEREHSPLLAIRDAYPKMIIARTHHETYDYQGVQVVDICSTIYKNYKLKSEVENLDKWDLQNELIQSCIIRDEEQDENLQKISKTSPNYRVSKQLILNEEQIDPANVIEINKTINPILVSVSGLNLSGVLNVLSDDDAILDTYNFETLEGKTDIYIDNIDISKIKFEISQGNISSLKIYELDGNAISTSMQALNKNHLQNVTFTDTEIHGNIKVSESSLLFIPIPYDKKWHVFVNGKESKIFHADEGFMAVILPVGNSKIQIKYISPFVKNGIILSIITILILICGNLMKKIIRNRKEGEK